jgi:hypothetical protein
VSVYIVVSSFWHDFQGSLLGVLLLATGIPAFFFWQKRYGRPTIDG